MKSRMGIRDRMIQSAGFRRPMADAMGIVGVGFYELRGEDGRLKQFGRFKNLITDVGDEFYAKKGALIAVNSVVGMRVGTGSTAVAKNGAGAAIVTYVSAITASKAIDGGSPTAATIGAGAGWRVTWVTTWNAGQATQNGLTEVVISNETTSITDVAGTAANTISRAILSPTVNKGASDTLAVTWQHNLLGA